MPFSPNPGFMPEKSTQMNVPVLMILFVQQFILYPVSDLAAGGMGIDDMKMLEQKAQLLAAEAEQDKPKPKEKILFVR